jgi:hypothetical protein
MGAALPACTSRTTCALLPLPCPAPHLLLLYATALVTKLQKTTNAARPEGCLALFAVFMTLTAWLMSLRPSLHGKEGGQGPPSLAPSRACEASHQRRARQRRPNSRRTLCIVGCYSKRCWRAAPALYLASLALMAAERVTLAFIAL